MIYNGSQIPLSESIKCKYFRAAGASEEAKEWAVKIAAEYDKKQIVLGLEPTGHYWFCLATWMISNGISVVQVNPYAVKQTKELEDNSQLKDDTKDPTPRRVLASVKETFM